MRMIDLSTLIAPSPEDTPPFERTDIAYSPHAGGAAQAQAILKVPSTVFRHEEGWATEEFTKFGTHNSTHIDAPWHYNSEIGGQRAQTIDELPLEWFFSDGVVLNMCHKADGDAMTIEDAQAESARIGYSLKPLDIVLVRTGRDEFYGRSDYIFRGCGVTAEATRWLYEQGVRVMGIDAWGWDAPLDKQAQEVLTRQAPGIFWAAHQVDLPYAQIERLVNLSTLPPFGFKVSCFPLKIKQGSAGPTRAVAILP
jgi:kynurenine formamidase